MRVTRILAALTAAGLVWAEWRTWIASRQGLPAGGADPSRIETGEIVLVLGHPWPVVQRWRVHIGVRSTDPRRARFIFSGGAVRTPVSEARMMADYAVVVLRVPAENVVLEDQSRTTVENVVNAAPLMDGPAIEIASDTFHARRARRILFEEDCQLADRLVRARDYRLLERAPLHALLLVHEYFRLYRAQSGRGRHF